MSERLILDFKPIVSASDMAMAYQVLKTLNEQPDNGMAAFDDYCAALKIALANGYHFIACWQPDIMVGVAGIRIMSDPWNAQPYAYINNLVVLPEHRRQGIGASLIQYCDKLASSLGVAHIGLNVRLYNAGAKKLYDRLGFKDSAFFMWKELKA